LANLSFLATFLFTIFFNTMNKQDLIEIIAKEAQIPKATVSKVINSYHKAVQVALAQGEKVSLPGFGTFDVSERKERSGRNPKTGESLLIAAAKRPRFKPGKSLKDTLV
jgi:DNA-binding protein HU-beta